MKQEIIKFFLLGFGLLWGYVVGVYHERWNKFPPAALLAVAAMIWLASGCSTPRALDYARPHPCPVVPVAYRVNCSQ